ncbi:MAG TPA: hypothetical protein ENH02_09200 [Bacteroidetes bacterium]|nr:hypothetical protein [Bacteroidota bacterium]
MEKNWKILIDALKKLPVYTPENHVWKKIKLYLAKNLASGKMPQLHVIDPPEDVWTSIDHELNRREKLSSLKRYNPPEEVWENIDRTLTTKLIKRRTVRWLTWSTAAAAVLILGLFIFTTNIGKNYSYSEEWVQIQDVHQWEEDDQPVEQALALLCSENPATCKTPEFKELQKELSSLNQSKQEILKQLNKYDANTELEIKLTEIELEKSELIKEMIAKTI